MLIFLRFVILFNCLFIFQFYFQQMSNDSQMTALPFSISPETLSNKSRRAVVIKDTLCAACGLLNSHHGGILKITSSKSLTPALLDDFVRGIEQTLIELIGVTAFRECCQIEIIDLGKEITFNVKPNDRLCTIEYNLFLPTDFLVKQVLRTEPLEKIAPLLKSGKPLDSKKLNNTWVEFVKDSIMPEDLRESDEVQFKKLKSDKNKNKSLADRIIANKITHYIAAFANHKGGHVFIGIDDETYKVCGQIVSINEKQRVTEKIESAVKSMVWPQEHGEPNRGKHWDLSFVPVVDESKSPITDLFVIVVAIAQCPGGVFLTYPEAYAIKNEKVVRMEFERWKKQLIHDANMRDIVKFTRENPWRKTNSCLIAKSESIDQSTFDVNKVLDASDLENNDSIAVMMPKFSSKNSKTTRLCRRITDYMEQLIQDGDFDNLLAFSSKICKNNAQTSADIEVAVRFMLALGAYRRRMFEDAYEELNKASSLIIFTENSVEFEVQRLHLLACFCRGENKHDTSYEVTYGSLQKIETVVPGWHTAWTLNDAGYLFGILAGEERNQEVKKSLKKQAISLYMKAIDHSLAVDKQLDDGNDVSVLKSNLLHRCHIRLAMLHLGCKPLTNDDDESEEVTDKDIEIAISSILVVEKSSLKGDLLTDVNECYLYLVKSDLSYRRAQLNVAHSKKNIKIAKYWATKAYDLAEKDKFPGIMKYAKSRIGRLSEMHCCNDVQDKLFVDLADLEEPT